MIRTVLGDIAPEDLGVTDAHEHLLIRGGLPVRLESDFRLDSVDKAVEEVRRFLAAGGKSLLDAMPGGVGRDPDGLVEIARRTGAHILAVTGFHKLVYYDTEHWLYRYGEDAIADLLALEIEEGMDRHGYRGPLVERSPARAGAIKLATDYYRMGPVEEKLFRAAAQAHLRTGAPILTHTEHGTLALEQATYLIRLGVPPERITIGHLDKNPDLDLHLEVLRTGVNVQYDQPGRAKYGPESRIVELLAGVVDAGLGDRVLLGLDLARRSYWRAFGGGPGMDYLLTRFVPRLRRAGFTEDMIHTLLVRNPARALALHRSKRS